MNKGMKGWMELQLYRELSVHSAQAHPGSTEHGHTVWSHSWEWSGWICLQTLQPCDYAWQWCVKASRLSYDFVCHLRFSFRWSPWWIGSQWDGHDYCTCNNLLIWPMHDMNIMPCNAHICGGQSETPLPCWHPASMSRGITQGIQLDTLQHTNVRLPKDNASSSYSSAAE